MYALVILTTFWICGVHTHASTVTTASTCPSRVLQGGTKFFKPYRGKCYKFYAHPDSKKQYWEAQTECKKNKGNLAMPKTEKVNQFLVDALKEYDIKEEVFIGLDDMDVENDFRWKDGSQLTKPNFYENFVDGHGIFRTKGGQSRDCVTLDPATNKWKDVECRRNILQRLTGDNEEHLFVCENEYDETEPDAGDAGDRKSENIAAKKDDASNLSKGVSHKQDGPDASNPPGGDSEKENNLDSYDDGLVDLGSVFNDDNAIFFIGIELLMALAVFWWIGVEVQVMSMFP
ncbi:macrophage mannose receptor 1 [Plakobranchus ocellatus]|uniref:Macrophage mannose receptor 1 n=1 Tax=Plakobranchus ocellatus TaxID=259542 RepID=A0AAV4C8G4_9GAST|nr:macrophage mannose receptor 1 [Plakobranchus ocellatus]